MHWDGRITERLERNNFSKLSINCYFVSNFSFLIITLNKNVAPFGQLES
jgi:hypothetical protein